MKFEKATTWIGSPPVCVSRNNLELKKEKFLKKSQLVIIVIYIL